jgi:hypothetical protein
MISPTTVKLDPAPTKLKTKISSVQRTSKAQFNVEYNPQLQGSDGCLEVFQKAIKRAGHFDSVFSFTPGSCSWGLQHVVVTCISVGGVSWHSKRIQPVEVLRIEQSKVKTSPAWCAAFFSLMKLKVRQVLEHLAQTLQPTSQEKTLQAFRPKARKDAIFCFSDHDVYWSYRYQLEALYTQYCPRKVGVVPHLLLKYSGREDHLLRKVQGKYMHTKQGSMGSTFTPRQRFP